MSNKLQLQVILSALDKATAPLKRIQGGSIGAAKGLKEARDTLKALNATQKDVSAWRTQRTAAAQTEQALSAAQQKVKELGREMAATGVPTKSLNRDMKAAIREATQLKQQHNQQQTALHGLRNKLSAAGVSTRNLSAGERDLRAKITATNSAMRQQEDRLKRITTQQKRLAAAKSQHEKTTGMAGSMAGSGAAGLATGYAISRPLMGLVDAFAPAENAATQLKVAMMASDGSVSEDFQKITELATSLGDRLPGTTADFQEMMTMLRRQGLSAKSILGGTGEAAAYLGVQLQMPVSAAAELAAKMQDATRTTEKDMMSLMDTIQRTFYLGVDSTNMLQGFSKISPVMGIIKKEGLEAANYLAPLLVMMDQTGMAGESAGNAFRKVFQGAMNTDKITTALNDLKVMKGIDLQLDFTDGKGEFGGLDKMFAQLNKLKGLSTEARLSLTKDLFGDDSETLQVLDTMMNKGMAGYEEVAAKMEAQADLRKRVNEQLGTLTNVMEAAQGSWTNAMAEVGAAVAPELKDLIKYFGDIATKIGAWARENPKLTAQIVKVAAGLGVLVAAGGAIMLTLGSILGPLALVRYGMALLSVATSAALWPILAVIAAVAALAVAAYLIYTHWDKIAPYFMGLWTEIKAGFNGGLMGILGLIINFSPIGMFYRAFAAVMGYFGVELPGKFTEFGGMLMDGMVTGITNGLARVKGAITGAGGAAIGWFKEKLGIHSPSKVFAELGVHTMDGLAQGITTGQANPFAALDDTSQQVIKKGAELSANNPFAALGEVTQQTSQKRDGVNAGNPFAGFAAIERPSIDRRPPISAGGGTAPAAPAAGPITIHIHAAPGMDPAAIGQEVQRQLATAQRNQQARGRARLGDLD